MNLGQDITDSQLHLYVDGELDPSENERILKAIEHDDAIRARVSQLQYLKALVKNQYPLERKHAIPHASNSKTMSWFSIAAYIIVLTAGMILGWMGHGLSTNNSSIADASRTTDHAAIAQSNKVLLHIDDSDPGKLQALIGYTEALLENNSENLKVEVVANASGLDIFRSGPGPEKARLRKLTKEYSNLELFACANAIAKLREKGVKVDLIPEAHTGATALEHIIQRMQEGWQYHKI